MKRYVVILIHEIAMATRFIGVRDRLRCPACRAVGTWKPHGGWQEQGTRRWLCKWCGVYYNFDHPELTRAYPNLFAGEWRPVITDREACASTPADVVNEELGDVWPWRG